MSLAAKIAASKKAGKDKVAEEARKPREHPNNRHIANSIAKARRKHETAFPSSDIETLTELAS